MQSKSKSTNYREYEKNNFLKKSTDLSSDLNKFFTEQEIEKVAIETGFVTRISKLTGYKFMDLLLFSKFDNKKLSLNDLSSQAEDKFNVTVSKQGIDNRFSSKSVEFVKSLLESYLKRTIDCNTKINFLDNFDRVLIKDSTSFQLPDNMKDKFPGSGGAGSKASMRIQFEYDYKTGDVTDLSLHAFNDQDMKNASETVEKVKESDLLLRDLGYIKIEVLKQIENSNAYFLNRLHSGTNVYEKINGKFVIIDFVNLRKEMNKKGIKLLDKIVYVGAKKELKVRMIIEELPEDKFQERIRKAQKEAKKKKRQLSDLFKAKACLNIFVTNINEEVLPVSKTRSLYRLRWQIELMFKVWKSVGSIDKVKNMKIERFETYLYSKLLWIMINWKILWEIQKHLWCERGIVISFFKAFKTLIDRIDKLREAIYASTDDIKFFILKIYKISHVNHKLEKKKNCCSSIEIFNFFTVQYD